MLNTEVSRLLALIRNSFIQSAAALLAGSILSFFLVPKQTQIVVEDNVPAQLMTLGEKNNPKLVYVSTRKHKLNLLPTLFSVAAAAAVAVIKIKYDNENKIISG